jgi:hypothetical protein
MTNPLRMEKFFQRFLKIVFPCQFGKLFASVNLVVWQQPGGTDET